MIEKEASQFSQGNDFNKGGHGTESEAIDIYAENGQVTHFSLPRISVKESHGTGCTLSSAINANLATEKRC